jgi:dTDP-4-dehydrorhamnose reductase
MVRQKIAVTGANGQLGMELRDASVLYPQYEFIFLTRGQLAVENTGSVNSFFTKNHPQYCINCAAYTAVDTAESEREEAFRINAEAVGILAAACKESNCRLIHISTDYVFDGNVNLPYKEDSATNPQSVYGASKLEGEKLAMQNNPETIIIRTSWVYSAYGKNFVKTMLRLMHEKETINVVNDQYGSPTYAADLAEVIMQIITKLTTHHSPLTTHGIYHFGNDGAISWYDFAEGIKKVIASSCKINPVPTSAYPTAAKRPAYSALDKTKIIQTFGIQLKDWKQSLADCIQKITKGGK